MEASFAVLQYAFPHKGLIKKFHLKAPFPFSMLQNAQKGGEMGFLSHFLHFQPPHLALYTLNFKCNQFSQDSGVSSYSDSTSPKLYFMLKHILKISNHLPGGLDDKYQVFF